MVRIPEFLQQQGSFEYGPCHACGYRKSKTLLFPLSLKAKGLSAEEYVSKLLELDLVPVWLQKVSGTSQQADLDQLSADEIDAEIAAARTDRHKVRLQLGS